MPQGGGDQLSLPHQPVHRAGQSHHGPGDGSGAGSPVRLQHVAVQGNCPLSQGLQVNRLAKSASDQPLDLHPAAVLLDPVPLLPLARGSGKHGIFRRDPALAFSFQKGRNSLLHTGRADHPGVPRGDQAAARRRSHKVRFNPYRAFFLRRSSVFTHTAYSFLTSPKTFV